jgi:hypothetical protein
MKSPHISDKDGKIRLETLRSYKMPAMNSSNSDERKCITTGTVIAFSFETLNQ